VCAAHAGHTQRLSAIVPAAGATQAQPAPSLDRCLQGKEQRIKHFWFLANAKCNSTKTKRA